MVLRAQTRYEDDTGLRGEESPRPRVRSIFLENFAVVEISCVDYQIRQPLFDYVLISSN